MYSVIYKYKTDYRPYYPLSGNYPVVQLTLGFRAKEADFLAIIDTGAENTMISPEYANEIGLILDEGKKKSFKPINGNSFIAYGHKVQVRILDEVFDTEVFFPEFRLPRCLIGRDILEKMQIGLNESLATLYLF